MRRKRKGEKRMKRLTMLASTIVALVLAVPAIASATVLKQEGTRVPTAKYITLTPTEPMHIWFNDQTDAIECPESTLIGTLAVNNGHEVEIDGLSRHGGPLWHCTYGKSENIEVELFSIGNVVLEESESGYAVMYYAVTHFFEPSLYCEFQTNYKTGPKLETVYYPGEDESRLFIWGSLSLNALSDPGCSSYSEPYFGGEFILSVDGKPVTLD
jgi:hypothetical protein